MDAWFDATVDSSLRAGTAAAAGLARRKLESLPHGALVDLILKHKGDSDTASLSRGRKGQRGGGRGRGRGKGRSKGRPRTAVVPGGNVDYSSTPMHKRRRDRPRELPIVPIGQNANTTLLRSLCPNQHYPSCFQDVRPPPPCAARGQHEAVASPG